MKYIDFINNLADDLQDALAEKGREIEVSVIKVNKSWGNELGLSFSDGGAVCPVIYPKEQYENHECGKDYFKMLNALAVEVEEIFDNLPGKFELDLEEAKDTIIIQLVNTEHSKEYLQDKVHREVEDLSIVYRLCSDFEGQGPASLAINYEMLNEMGLNESELYELAMEKAPLNRACIIKNLVDISLMLETVESPLVVVTNEDRVLGASAMMYPGTLERCAAVMNGDFFVLPSSVHEMLILPDNDKISLDGLKSMVYEVNNTVLDQTEFLSNNVYHYDHKEKIFEIADKYVERMNAKAKNSVIDSLKEKKNNVMKKGLLNREHEIGSRKIQGLSH